MYNRSRENAIEYNKKVGLLGIIRGHKQGFKDQKSLAEFLDVSEDYLQKALFYYHCQYGGIVEIDNYIIFFRPQLRILEIIYN